MLTKYLLIWENVTYLKTHIA